MPASPAASTASPPKVHGPGVKLDMRCRALLEPWLALITFVNTPSAFPRGWAPGGARGQRRHHMPHCMSTKLMIQIVARHAQLLTCSAVELQLVLARRTYSEVCHRSVPHTLLMVEMSGLAGACTWARC